MEERWQNDLYEHLAAGSAAQTNPIAASLLETLDEPRFKEIRNMVLDEMHLYPGAVTLEVGCGPGMFAEEILARTGPGSSAHGLDINPHFIRIAEQRAEMLGLRGAEFVTGDCHTLPYEDEMFDAVVAERLLMHVAPISRVLGEIARVLTIGGRAVLVDYDPYTAFAAGPNPTITSRILASAATMYANPLAARETPAVCGRLGLIVERVRGHLLIFEDATIESAGGIAAVWSEHAVAGRQVDRSTVQRWMLAIERAAREGRFMIAIPHVITVATRSY